MTDSILAKRLSGIPRDPPAAWPVTNPKTATATKTAGRANLHSQSSGDASERASIEVARDRQLKTDGQFLD